MTQPPSSVYTYLCYLSDYIVGNRATTVSAKHYDEFQGAYYAVKSDQRKTNILNGTVRNGIFEIIWRISDCLKYVKGKTAEELERELMVIIH